MPSGSHRPRKRFGQHFLHDAGVVRKIIEAITELTADRGVNVILDIIGGDYLERNLKALAVDGRLIQIGLQGGAKSQIDLRILMQRRLTLTGSTLRPRSVAE